VSSAKEVVQVLLAHGADRQACNASGATAGDLLLQLLLPASSRDGGSPAETAGGTSMPPPLLEVLSMLQTDCVNA
jgi:hypothetical protein